MKTNQCFKDSNANGTLEDTETILDTAVICNGEDGDDRLPDTPNL